jgi:hypothetical protein
MPNPVINRRNQISNAVAGPPPITVLPTDFSGLGPWWKADSLSLNDGDPVSTWLDSNTSNNATATTTARPTYKTNIFGSMPALLFNGTTNIMTCSGVTVFPNSIPWTFFLVYSLNPSGTGGEILGPNGGNAYGAIWTNSTNIGFFDSTFNFRTKTPPSGNAFRVIVNRNLNFRDNKTDLGNVGGSYIGASFGYTRIGGCLDFPDFLNGYIAEIVIYPSTNISDANCDSLYDNYFRPKYYPALP